MSFEAREYQSTAVMNLRAGLSGGFKRQILSSPTGSGKTEIGMILVRGAVAKGKRVGFLCNRINLVGQTSARFFRAGIPHGVIQGQNTSRTYEPVLVASIQTVAKRGMPEVDLLIIDEAHGVAGSKDYRKVISEHKGPVIGLSATPFSKGLGKHYDELGGALFEKMVIAASIRELIAMGFLVDCEVYAPSQPDLSKVKITAGDYNERELGEAVDKPVLIGDIVVQWKKHANNTPTVCFATNIAHSQHIVAQFLASGVKAEHIDCYTEEEDRAAILARVASGETMVISNVGILTEGWDMPACKTMILARPTKSLIRYLQMAGRVLRPYPGKTCLARGTKVLTDKGNVEIQNVTLDHKVWDGHNFVHHGGAVCNGMREVMEYDGLIATPDHEVMTNDGFKRIEEAASRKIRITRSGFGGKPVRVIENNLTKNRGQCVGSSSGSLVLTLWRGAYGSLSQYAQEAQHGGLSALQWSPASNSTAVAVSSVPIAASQMQYAHQWGIQKLRRAWGKILVCWSQRSGDMGSGKLGSRREKFAAGPHQQRWALRAWEFAVGASSGKCQQYAKDKRIWNSREICEVSHYIPEYSVCRQNFKPPANNNDGRGNLRAVGASVMQAKREVWDILNAGPLQRFTANGRLVHNCALILDHSGTVQSIGFPTDDFPMVLCDGKPKQSTGSSKEAEPPKPSKCPSCAYVKKTGGKCPVCGFVPQKPNTTEHAPGELAKLEKKKTLKTPEKRQLYAELKTIANEKKWSDGRLSNVFRDIAGTYPNSYRDAAPATPSPETLKAVQYLNIKFAKSKAKNVAR